MNLTFKLYATLAELLPAEAVDHAIAITVTDGVTINEVIDMYRVPRKSAHLVLVNGIYIAPEERDTANLTDGDTLAIWPPVAGG